MLAMNTEFVLEHTAYEKFFKILYNLHLVSAKH